MQQTVSLLSVTQFTSLAFTALLSRSSRKYSEKMLYTLSLFGTTLHLTCKRSFSKVSSLNCWDLGIFYMVALYIANCTGSRSATYHHHQLHVQQKRKKQKKTKLTKMICMAETKLTKMICMAETKLTKMICMAKTFTPRNQWHSNSHWSPKCSLTFNLM